MVFVFVVVGALPCSNLSEPQEGNIFEQHSWPRVSCLLDVRETNFI